MRVAKGWGLCPSCDAALPHPKCAACGWQIEDLLLEHLEAITRVLRGDYEIHDPENTARDLAHHAMGSDSTLLQLGAIDTQKWRAWNERFLEAANIPFEPIEISIHQSFRAEAGVDQRVEAPKDID